METHVYVRNIYGEHCIKIIICFYCLSYRAAFSLFHSHCFYDITPPHVRHRNYVQLTFLFYFVRSLIIYRWLNAAKYYYWELYYLFAVKAHIFKWTNVYRGIKYKYKIINIPQTITLKHLFIYIININCPHNKLLMMVNELFLMSEMIIYCNT